MNPVRDDPSMCRIYIYKIIIDEAHWSCVQSTETQSVSYL